MGIARVRLIVIAALAAGISGLPLRPAAAWGPDAHRVVALIADRILQQGDAPVRAKLTTMLTDDKDNKWTKHDIASEATWADVLRDKSEEARLATTEWHYVRLKFDNPDLTRDCANRPALPSGYPASHGPRENCVVDKIEQFEKELQNPETLPGERRSAVQFLLNLVADINDPLHAIDRGDHEGQCVAVQIGSKAPVRLATLWQATLPAQVIGHDPAKGAASVMAGVKADDLQKWAAGGPEDWAQDSYEVAKTVAYSFVESAPAGKQAVTAGKGDKGDKDPCGGKVEVYKVGPDYETAALAAIKQQLGKAGIRLALVLRENLK